VNKLQRMSIARRIVVGVLALATVTTACSTDSATAPTETTVAPSVTETLEGRLGVHGAAVHPFVVAEAGTVTASVSALDPNDAVIGISLGTWNAATSACQVLLANDAAAVGSSFVGSASVAGTFCIRIIDVGRLTSPVSYSVSVTHT
jgi:hypothetical protein